VAPRLATPSCNHSAVYAGSIVVMVLERHDATYGPCRLRKTDDDDDDDDINNSKVRPLWDVTIAGPPRCPVWCRLVTVPADPFTTSTRPTGPLLSECAKCQPGTVLPIANLMADSESGSPLSCSSFLVTIGLSRLVSEIIRVWQTNGQRGPSL